MITSKQYYWRYTQIALILVLGLIIFKEMWVFSGGFLGAFTIYVLVRKQMHWLTESKKMRKSIAAFIILLEVVVCFLIPAGIAVLLLFKMINYILINSSELISSAQATLTELQARVNIDVLDKDTILQATGILTQIGTAVVGEISSFMINAFVLLFVLFFMLMGSRAMEKYVFELLPFDDKNKEHMSSEVEKMVISNAIGIPLLAIVQGITATLGYYFLDVPLPFLFGLLTCFATIIPLLGTTLVWAPLSIYLMVMGEWGSAIGLAIFGIVVISNVDNLFRFLLQKKMADIHPLITVFGVFIGLSLYGFWGVIFGPVLLSIFLIMTDILKKEYIDKDKQTDKEATEEESAE